MLRIGYSGLVISIATIAAFLLGNHYMGAAAASTMAFATLCMSRLFHGFSCKSDEPVLFSGKMFNNSFGILAFIAGMLLINCVLLIPALSGLFKVVKLSGGLLAATYALSFGSMIVIQIIKALFFKVKK